ncbi:MAG: hypothetical protein LBU75_10595 [Desulfovibrio sp.]|nr:hypothetical protein [Desulfovibrio sp.]
MKMLRWVYCIVTLVAMLFLHAVDGYCTERSPEQVVHDFYAWYFVADRGEDMAEKNDAIYKYVAKPLITDVRADTSGIYYFTKVGSYGAWWVDVVVDVKDAVSIGGGVSMIPVEFVLGQERRSVIVLVKSYDGELKIFKVMDVYPFM